MRLLAVAFVLVAAGCGGSSGVVRGKHSASLRLQRECHSWGLDANSRVHSLESGFRLCRNLRGSKSQSTIEQYTGTSWRVLAGPLSGPDGSAGEWQNVDRSPDGRTLLLQWGGPCEVPNAFFLSSDGSDLRTVTGERDWHKAPMSRGSGWADDGRARVRVLSGGCGTDYSRPGVYLIDPATSRGELLRPLRKREGG